MSCTTFQEQHQLALVSRDSRATAPLKLRPLELDSGQGEPSTVWTGQIRAETKRGTNQTTENVLLKHLDIFSFSKQLQLHVNSCSREIYTSYLGCNGFSFQTTYHNLEEFKLYAYSCFFSCATVKRRKQGMTRSSVEMRKHYAHGKKNSTRPQNFFARMFFSVRASSFSMLVSSC